MPIFLYWYFAILAALTHVRNPEPERLEIYLAIGQSNMAGRAALNEKLLEPLNGAYLFKNAGGERWIPATNPMNLFSTVRKEVEMQQLSPAFGFAKSIRGKRPKEIGMVVNARGGTAIGLWLPGTEYYSAFMDRIKDAAKDGEVKGVIWHQGESDVRDLSHYMEDLQNLIGQIRKDLGKPNLPFVAGQVVGNTPERLVFNQMILQLPKLVSHTAVVSSEGTKVFDEVHFDTESQLILGERYAEKMMGLLEKTN
ncbi:sialate O-acetylesterase [Pleomorphovibrio marinus]|uniref:sialate O-acetylesterase n=1 Tax=Pleomorphovibrio marinus TaxID=2164132 RepID=UPI000E0C94F8|nr:sialate O-acetylesterase [Pleomorphovibrio marinus]